MTFSVGSLVRARGREWVVLPGSDAQRVRLRPLGGTDQETTSLLTNLEPIQAAKFSLPSVEDIGDYHSAHLLRAAVRLGFRSSAGPFRSFGSINVEPRPYQLVPLLMALKLDPVRLLIADDVGIGKTIEALLIARELLERGEIERLAVLCPPQLAEQWQAELAEKFYIEAQLVLSSTAPRLERHLHMGESLFEKHPFVVVSTDFIKSESRRNEFLRTAPNFIIVDEAHSVVHSSEAGRHQRYELVAKLAEDRKRHLVLVTATPHSGKEDAFRTLLGLLDPQFAQFDEDTHPTDENFRRQLARHFVQRRRADIQKYLDAETPFPKRHSDERTYSLSQPYRALFDSLLNYARQTVLETDAPRHRQRVRWWSALALLRAMASSPAAAAATLRTRAAVADTQDAEEADRFGQRAVLDQMSDEGAETFDFIPGSDPEEFASDSQANQRRLRAFATQAEALQGQDDLKLKGLISLVKDLLQQGDSPIIFCRFIPTVDYLVQELREAFREAEIIGVTGLQPPAEREERIYQLGQHPKRVLVCTDCLSEGINLQNAFNAVIHYDLSWNPTRHEQREGRVDRYGQTSPTIKVFTYYGKDNQIDSIVLDVLLRKHKNIRNALGISIPVPGNSEDVIEAIFEGLLLQEDTSPSQATLPSLEAYNIQPKQLKLDDAWQKRAEREKQSRALFAQHSLKVEDVAAELRAARESIGSGIELANFMQTAVQACGGTVTKHGLSYTFDFSETTRSLRDLLPLDEKKLRVKARFELPVHPDELYLTRTHPLVAALATYLFNTALDSTPDPDAHRPARRAGVMRSRAVQTRTTLLLLRLRYHLRSQQGEQTHHLLAEESLSLAFEGAPDAFTGAWLPDAQAEALLQAQPDSNLHPQQASEFLRKVILAYDHLRPHLEHIAHERAQALLQAHQRVRKAANQRVRQDIQPQLPPDILGIYVFLPSGKA